MHSINKLLCKYGIVRFKTQIGFHLGDTMGIYSFTAAGNYEWKVSSSAGQGCNSFHQETYRKWFLTRHATIVFYHKRNFSPIVSYSVEPHYSSSQQETFLQ